MEGGVGIVESPEEEEAVCGEAGALGVLRRSAAKKERTFIW
jgi:hypothetical protein